MKYKKLKICKAESTVVCPHLCYIKHALNRFADSFLISTQRQYKTEMPSRLLVTAGKSAAE